MSKRELQRIEVLSRVVGGRLSVTQAAGVMGLSPRQVQRRLRPFREAGAPALRHKARGRLSNNRILVKKMRLEGIRDMDAANAFRPGFVARHNGRFARVPARPDDLHRPLADGADRRRDIRCWRDQRYVGQQLTLTYERKRILLEETEVTRGLAGQYVETYAFPDGRFEVRWTGIALPCRAFDPDQQHVTHAAITENKRLSAVLSAIQEMQEASAPKVTPVGKPRTRYQPKDGPRKPRKSWMDGRAARRAAEGAQDVPAPDQAAE